MEIFLWGLLKGSIVLVLVLVLVLVHFIPIVVLCRSG